MAQSSIITGQYVELSQTPASVGDRLLAAIIDIAVLSAYSIAASIALGSMNSRFSGNDLIIIIVFSLTFFPVIIYNPLCEIFAHGQSLGKYIMKMRVVTADGNTPTVGSSLLRWILYPIDTFLTGFVGIVFILFSKHRQRLGDLAAGTIVIKTTATQYDFFALNDYNYVQHGYVPSFPNAANLSTRQVDLIVRTLYCPDPQRRSDLVYRLAVKVQQYLDVQLPENTMADAFLTTILNDFYYYNSTLEV